MLLAVDKRTEELRKLVKLCEFNLDIERICVYLEKDLQESVADSLDSKMIVAEVALIERQFMGIMGGLDTNEIEEVMDDEVVTASNPFLVLVDNEELGLIGSKIEEIKSRLVLAGSSGAAMDYGTAGKIWKMFVAKVKEGFDFVGGGTQMLGSDLMEAGKLFLKALNGNVLRPREVNTIRRTAKDLLTMIPFLIILIIPLSPIGHVLVFSFIQRYLPEFFPSVFTEKRQNLRQLYTDVITTDEEALLGTQTRIRKRDRLNKLWKRVTFQEGEKNDR